MTSIVNLVPATAAGDTANDMEQPVEPSLASRIAALRERAQRMAAPNPFKLGDVVTVRADADVKGAGQPHVVVEVYDKPIVDTKSETGSNQYLRTFDMRVAHFQGDHMTVHAIEHAVLEPWTEAHAQAIENRTRSDRSKGPTKILNTTSLQEVVRLLRSEGRRRLDAKITWKKGDLVEILGHEESRATEPMRFEGRSVGVVETVDRNDDTTRVIYFGIDGERCTQWLKQHELRPYSAVEIVDSSDAGDEVEPA
jgi:hypothetical protein